MKDLNGVSRIPIAAGLRDFYAKLVSSSCLALVGPKHTVREFKATLKETSIRLDLPQVRVPSKLTGFDSAQIIGNLTKSALEQWKYITGNSWGVNPQTGVGCIGCGPTQEQFYGCADVTISMDGSPLEEPYTTTARPASTDTTKQTYTNRPAGETTTSHPITGSTNTKCPNGDGYFADFSTGIGTF